MNLHVDLHMNLPCEEKGSSEASHEPSHESKYHLKVHINLQMNLFLHMKVQVRFQKRLQVRVHEGWRPSSPFVDWPGIPPSLGLAETSQHVITYFDSPLPLAFFFGIPELQNASWKSSTFSAFQHLHKTREFVRCSLPGK